MRNAPVALCLSSLLACVPSVDLDLPAPEGVAAYAVLSPDRPATLFDADAVPESIGVGDDEMYVVTLGKTLDELTLGRTTSAGPRPLLTSTSTLWRSTEMDGRLEWRVGDDAAVEPFAADFDYALCFTTAGQCVRRWNEASPYCDLACDAPTVPLAPVGYGQFDRTALYVAQPCPEGQAAFGDGACRAVAACGEVDDVPSGTRFDVRANTSLADALRDQAADVFVLEPGDYGAVVAQRPVTIWGRCPTQTTVQRIELPVGGHVGRVAVDELVVMAATQVTKTVVGAVAADGPVRFEDSVVRSGILRAPSTFERVVIDGTASESAEDATVRIETTTATLTQTRVVGRARLDLDRVDARIVDLGLDGPERLLLAANGSKLEIVGLSAHGVMSEFAVGIQHGRTDARDVRLEAADKGIFLRGGTSTFVNVWTDFVAFPVAVVSTASASTGGWHEFRHVDIHETVTGFSIGGRDDVGAAVDLEDVHVQRANTALWLRSNANVQADRIFVETLVIALEVDGATDVAFRDVTSEGVDQFLLGKDVERLSFERVRITDTVAQVAQLGAPLIGTNVTFADLVLEQSKGFEIIGRANLRLERFRLSGSEGPAFSVVPEARLELVDGAVEGFPIGVRGPSGYPLHEVFEGVHMSLKSPVDRK